MDGAFRFYAFSWNEIEGALKDAGFSKIKTAHHESKLWITVIAEK